MSVHCSCFGCCNAAPTAQHSAADLDMQTACKQSSTSQSNTAFSDLTQPQPQHLSVCDKKLLDSRHSDPQLRLSICFQVQPRHQEQHAR